MIRSWKAVKRSGAYARNLKSEREAFENKVEVLKKQILMVSANVNNIDIAAAPSAAPADVPDALASFLHADVAPDSPPFMPEPTNDVVATNNNADDMDYFDQYYCVDSEDSVDDDDGDADDEDDEISANELFRDNLRNWALQFRISHFALNGLLKIIDTRLGAKSSGLPLDARTLLLTPRSIIPVQALSGGGEYWHNGLKICLSNTFQNLDKSISISLNINIDGIPVFNSSKVSFWPILSNITEFPKISPMVVGIYCGASKITDIGTYFSPFVDELEEIMANGLYIKSHKISVSLRCFVCDSPARAFVKGNIRRYK